MGRGNGIHSFEEWEQRGIATKTTYSGLRDGGMRGSGALNVTLLHSSYLLLSSFYSAGYSPNTGRRYARPYLDPKLTTPETAGQLLLRLFAGSPSTLDLPGGRDGRRMGP